MRSKIKQNRASAQKTLRDWVFSNAAKPVYLTLAFILVIQLLFVASKVYTNRVELREAATNLSNVLSVGLFQKNRVLIETSSAFALSSSEIQQICILEGGKISFSVPIARDGECEPTISVFSEKLQIQMKNMPQYDVRFILPKYPGFSGIMFLVLVSSLVTVAIFLVLFAMLRKIETELIIPLKENIGRLDILDRDFQSRDFFEIVELDQLIKSYFGRMVEVKQLTDQEAALSKDAAIGRITASLSHDLRAPLGTFEKLLFLSDDKLSDMKGSIKDSLNRIYAMIDSLRFGETENLVKRSIDDLTFSFGGFALKARCEERGINFDFPQGILPEVCIDHPKVERAWMNLASNAIDFAITTIAITIEFKGATLLIRVMDDGDGVPDELMPRLFQRGATHGKADGTGLGLAYVRQIMRGHGGDVTYRRENGLSIFECILPNAVEPAKDQPVEKSATLEVQLLQKIVRKVAICLEPKELSDSVLTKLTSLNSDDFVFIEERNEANIVVSNIESIMFEVMESDEQEHISVAQFKDDLDWMIEVLKRRFNLT
jgi:signal transduction histidine kinase